MSDESSAGEPEENRDSESFDIDTEVLIREIKSLEVLWDVNNEFFRDRHKRREAWDGVCAALCADYKKLRKDTKTQFGKIVQSKWRNIRDCYTKSKRCHSYGKSAKKHKKYIYENRLRFLDTIKSGVPSSTEDSLPKLTDIVKAIADSDQRVVMLPQPDKQPEIIAEMSHNEKQNPRTSQKRKKKLATSQEKFPKCLDKKKVRRLPDAHQSFFNSLLPIVRGFNEDQVLEFRAEVIKTAQNIRLRQQSFECINFPSSVDVGSVTTWRYAHGHPHFSSQNIDANTMQESPRSSTFSVGSASTRSEEDFINVSDSD